MELVTFLEDTQMAFFSFGEHDHDLAVIKVSDQDPVGSAGLAHTAIEVNGGVDRLQELYATFEARRVGSSSPPITYSRRASTCSIPTATAWSSTRS